MPNFESKRGRITNLTADGYSANVNDILWDVDNLSSGLTLQVFASDFVTTGLVSVDGSFVHLSTLYYVRKNAMADRRQVITEKIQDHQRDIGSLSSDLRQLDQDIRDEP